jgi:hypothetical protein
MDTMTLETTMQSAMQQMGLAAMHWYSVAAFLAAILLSLCWMAAGLLRDTREF